ncbi:MAG: hypothetical protein WCL32_20495, partial [Planctomycetota bacterium]
MSSAKIDVSLLSFSRLRKRELIIRLLLPDAFPQPGYQGGSSQEAPTHPFAKSRIAGSACRILCPLYEIFPLYEKWADDWVVFLRRLRLRPNALVNTALRRGLIRYARRVEERSVSRRQADRRFERLSFGRKDVQFLDFPAIRVDHVKNAIDEDVFSRRGNERAHANADKDSTDVWRRCRFMDDFDEIAGIQGPFMAEQGDYRRVQVRGAKRFCGLSRCRSAELTANLARCQRPNASKRKPAAQHCDHDATENCRPIDRWRQRWIRALGPI